LFWDFGRLCQHTHVTSEGCDACFGKEDFILEGPEFMKIWCLINKVNATRETSPKRGSWIAIYCQWWDWVISFTWLDAFLSLRFLLQFTMMLCTIHYCNKTNPYPNGDKEMHEDAFN
jgi:hypothetical protein